MSATWFVGMALVFFGAGLAFAPSFAEIRASVSIAACLVGLGILVSTLYHNRAT